MSTLVRLPGPGRRGSGGAQQNRQRVGLAAGYTSIDLSVSYLRPITLKHKILRAEGAVVKPGARVIFAEGRIIGPAGELLATATGSLLVFALTAPKE